MLELCEVWQGGISVYTGVCGCGANSCGLYSVDEIGDSTDESALTSSISCCWLTAMVVLRGTTVEADVEGFIPFGELELRLNCIH